MRDLYFDGVNGPAIAKVKSAAPEMYNLLYRLLVLVERNSPVDLDYLYDIRDDAYQLIARIWEESEANP